MPNERPVEQPVRPAAEALHAAVCQAVALLNRAPEVARCAEGREARDLLRQALVDYADAYMDEPAPERERAQAAEDMRSRVLLGEARDCCDYCDDGDGHSIFPYYGTAPHIHAGGDGWISSTQLLPRAMWGSNFREDPECEGHGVYMRCQKCGRGEQPEA